ncbi:helicase-like transcription factor CHR28 isoform X2 [Silene latifolia]|uniref:helicase-like transcription factor CHR28 isoform X2 n=1 Tax=Silene latifolia TaxID=37657 RepID=UPI003D776008
MMMSASADDNKGFDFDCMYDFSSDVVNHDDGDDVDIGGLFVDNGGGGDDDFAIDIDSFFTILDEELPPQENPLPELPNNPFYPAVDSTQERVSGAHVGNNCDSNFRLEYVAERGSSAEKGEALEQVFFTSPLDMSLTEANGTSPGKSNIERALDQSPLLMKTECFSSTQDCLSTYDIYSGFPNQNSLDGMGYGMMLTNDAVTNVVKLNDSVSSHAWTDEKTILASQVQTANTSSSEITPYYFIDSTLHDNFTFDQVNTFNTVDSSSTTTDDASADPFCWRQMNQPCIKQAVEIKDERDRGLAVLNGFEGTSCVTSKNDAFGGTSFDFGDRKSVASSETRYSGSRVGHSNNYRHSFVTDRKPTNLPLLNGFYANSGGLPFNKGVEKVVEAANIKYDAFCGSNEVSGARLLGHRVYSEADDNDDDDVCVIEDLSAPAQVHQYSVHKKSVTSHMSTFSPACLPLALPNHQVAVNAARVKAADERLIFQAVVQDLSQPKSEATPPDGVLDVPLLRHQRIALSWMVQKETTSVQCSGGILADDQGLGKTVSTIALILTERAPVAKTMGIVDQREHETLDLEAEGDKKVKNGPATEVQSSSSVKGRPSGGTLVVCPTSVLRQWGDELRNKVSDKVKLSVCMYHGSGRTKDPYELANYDVVLTTYSIVSMEVPKPVSLKEDEKRKRQADDAGASSKKRKHPSKSDKRRLKKVMDDGFLESSARPLARVNWFRVVLDEAQSIKNYRTQVAQACWGLRAKRRWCLSGTPIQNSVDDLYSYFRFLRYDPYSVYKSFCSMVKFPIVKDPINGYKKLQAVLKTIMLRRTKGTLLDGEPIINLPPKSVKLKKVEFSQEERDFYTRLEADSRAQFQAYAESGTVKQNYVNILLMLLRLRQACDHPFLVKGYGSNSALKSSISAAKKLPREQQICLLNCLEASLAICGICRDPPEDAVVSICGHVFCNQCISERLTGDDNQCPVIKCKTQLCASSIFSKGALKSCRLSPEFSRDGSQVCSPSESYDQAELAELSPAHCFNSSKIKTALKVLKSLSKPQMIILDNTSMESSITDESPVASKGSASSGVVEKAIVFSQWTSMLDLLEDGLKECSIHYRRLDGTMSVLARDKAVKDFNTLPEVSVMIMSLKAASLGLNMVAACHVLLLDLWWNPTTEDQAIDRAHRIGQTRPVTVVRLTVKDTVEDRILALQQKKRELAASAFGEDETGNSQTRLTVEDLKYLFMA